MAAEIGLTLRGKSDNVSEIDTEIADQLRRNEIRTRAWMIINEHRYVAQPMIDETSKLGLIVIQNLYVQWSISIGLI